MATARVVKVPRLSHPKSRNGCQRCKARKVKCNEAYPSCAGCLRHKVSCEYVGASPEKEVEIKGFSKATSEASSHTRTSTPPDTATLSIKVESKERRLLELQLFHHFTTVTTRQPFLANHDAGIQEMWNVHVPCLALKNTVLLNGVFSAAALHLTTIHPERVEFADAHRRYFNAAVSEQRHALVDICEDNADALVVTGILIMFQSFMLLRPQHYALPMQWLDLSFGCVNTFLEAWPIISNGGKTMAILKAYPLMSWVNDSIPDEKHRIPFSPRLTRDAEPANQAAFERAISYVGLINEFIEKGGGASAVRRLIINFAPMAQARYVELLREKHPQALVILAHLFALAKAVDNVWWMRGAAEKEVVGIQSLLPEEWQWAMAWPLEKLAFYRDNERKPTDIQGQDGNAAADRCSDLANLVEACQVQPNVLYDAKIVLI